MSENTRVRPKRRRQEAAKQVQQRRSDVPTERMADARVYRPAFTHTYEWCDECQCYEPIPVLREQGGRG